MSRVMFQFMLVYVDTQNDANFIIHRIINLYSGTSLKKRKIIIKQVNRNIYVSHILQNKLSIKSYRL